MEVTVRIVLHSTGRQGLRQSRDQPQECAVNPPRSDLTCACADFRCWPIILHCPRSPFDAQLRLWHLDKCGQGLSFQLNVFLAEHRRICTDLVKSGQPDKCGRGGLVPAAVIVACRRPEAYRTFFATTEIHAITFANAYNNFDKYIQQL